MSLRYFLQQKHTKNCVCSAPLSWKIAAGCTTSAFCNATSTCLAPVDSFKSHSSESLEQDLAVGFHEANYGVSIDVEELFYSVQHGELCLAVHDAIESCSVVPFQNTSLINMDNFLELLKCYLCSTIVSFDKTYVQKRSICTGSCVAPML